MTILFKILFRNYKQNFIFGFFGYRDQIFIFSHFRCNNIVFLKILSLLLATWWRLAIGAVGSMIKDDSMNSLRQLYNLILYQNLDNLNIIESDSNPRRSFTWFLKLVHLRLRESKESFWSPTNLCLFLVLISKSIDLLIDNMITKIIVCLRVKLIFLSD